MKSGQKVIITKPGKLNGLIGDIISNNEIADKPLTVDLNPFGTWSFKLNEVINYQSETLNVVGYKKVKDGIEITVEPLKKDINITLATPESLGITKVKRPYKKRVEPKEVKPKRKYQRKNVD